MIPGTRANGPASLQLVRMAGIDKSVTQGLLEIKSVKTDKAQRRQGHASVLMEQVCKEADESKTILVLTPAQFDNGPIGTQQLKCWYERFGFVVIQEKPVLMCRDPVVSLEQVAAICEAIKVKNIPAGRHYDIQTDKFYGEKATVEVDGIEHKLLVPDGFDAKNVEPNIRQEVSEG